MTVKQFLFAVAVLATTRASGLDCVALPQGEAFQSAYTVFRGTVTNVESVGGTIDTNSGPIPTVHMDAGSGVVATFQVRRGWKGPVAPVMRLFLFEHPQQGAGYSLSRNGEYIVYANDEVRQDWDVLRPFTQKGAVYRVGPCPRIRTDLGTEEKKLGPGHEPH
jgi:hypothetical protein